VWNWFWAIVGIGGAFAGVALIVYLQWRGPADHEAEEAARAHFDATGRWPDEPAS
jgi:hypothetical protein